MIASYEGSSSPVTLSPGSISNISLIPYLTDSCTSNLVSGMTTFFQTTFSTSHEVPVGGTIKVVYLNGNPTGDFFRNDGEGGHCLVSSHQSDDISCGIS